ncbi:glycoside hydrolase domain-containing protein [Peterkaempfera bronchialis]|uniref:glycoside hydrolase domain-containing protein n=1 Tax=Peterkaempfera bronchialis TaxID=2126346 RepID=UPI003C2D7B86
MSSHRMSKRRRYVAWSVAGAAVLVGGGLTAEAATTSSSAPTAASATTSASTSRPAPSVYTGRAFDTCTAPSLSAMKAWKASKFYGAAAVYVGGKNRGCAQPQLTASWVKSVTASGWKLIPLYVGAQPPCQSSRNPERISSANAAKLGAANGADAVAKASKLGMKAGSAIYLDMEPYDISNTSCVNSVLTYIRAWDRAVHAKGYWAGFYGFKSTSAAAVANAKDRTDLPDALWYALYDKTNTTTSDFPYRPTLWTGHRRGHQYMVNSKETRGGVTLTVDRSAWDAPVAVIAK